jgi:D-sedoheptulose 7-phosphate isomerase
MERWTDYLDIVANGLKAVEVTARDGAALSPAEGFARWVAMTLDVDQRDAQLFVIGNGGSAGMASHMATDACKNGKLRALALNDFTMLTAAGNDIAYEHVFSLQLERLARRGDLLVTISSSGNSPNVIAALGAAARIGVGTVTLSAKTADNRSRALGDLNFYVPLARYGWAESAHQIVLHYWFDQFLHQYRDGAL